MELGLGVQVKLCVVSIALQNLGRDRESYFVVECES